MTTPRLLLPLLLAAGLPAATIVPGVADVWLAGQPNGATVTGIFGSDIAPDQSPVEVPISPGFFLTFSVTGTTSNDGVCTETSADAGNCFFDVGVFGAGPANGIGAYMGPANALIGVFLDASVPTGPGGPPAIDFTGANNFAALAPMLNQFFFIGDGLTGTDSGAVQRFYVPAGATRLVLASADSQGSSFNNTGAFDVTISATATPEPGTFALLGAAACCLGFRRRR